jgi:GTP-binding protein
VRVLESDFVTSAAQLRECPDTELSELAFLGRSNVGKSSMINALLGRRKLARVSRTPGRTRLLNFFRARLEVGEAKEKLLSVCDLPGYGYAKAPRDEVARWQSMIEGYLKGRSNLMGAVALLDARREPSPQDRTLLEWLSAIGRPVLPVVTKVDKLTAKERRWAERTISAALPAALEPIGFSAVTGEGRDALWARLAELAWPEETLG